MSLTRFTWLMTRMCSAPIAVVEMVQDGRAVLKASSGPHIGASDFCLHVKTEPLIVEDASQDPRFAQSAIVAGPPGVRFYAGFPLRGGTQGSIAIMDTQPRRLIGAHREQLEALADIVSTHTPSRNEEHYLRAILAATSEGIAVTDEAGELVWVNPLAERVIEHYPDLLAFQADKREVALPDGDSVLVSWRQLSPGKSVLALFRDITDSATDLLTGLATRRALLARLDQLVAEGNRGRKFAIVRVGLKDFSQINDTYGTPTGDAALKAIAIALRKVVRRTDFVARSAGQEFCVVYTDVDAQIVPMLAEKVRSVVLSSCRPLTVNASLGLCVWKPEHATVDALMAAAQP